jgi:pimeloyl-ACP methyl ester carboxylesterase
MMGSKKTLGGARYARGAKIVCFVAAFCAACMAFAETEKEKKAPVSPAGHWEGAIKLPAAELQVEIALTQSKDGAWSGTIDIPMQGLRSFKLGKIEVADQQVAFSLPNIPGDPQFDGKLSADGKAIEGKFTQGGQGLTFYLKRAEGPPKPAGGATPARGVPGKGLPGFWQGSLHAGPIELRLVFKFKLEPDGKISGLLDSVDQNARDIPISSVTEKDGEVKLEVAAVGGEFAGKMSADGSEVAGKWTQPGAGMPLVIRRLAEAPALSRPQEPKPPFPYEVEEVTFESDADVQLAGTLTRPKGKGPFAAVVLITGSGPQDRDEALMGHRPFFVLADHLTRHGIAVLRYDDRGVGKSKGNYMEAAMDDFVADALAALRWLRSRPDVDDERVGMVGHSEGSVIASVATAKSPAEVKFLVFLAGVGVPMDQLLTRQAGDIGRAMGMSDEMVAETTKGQRAVFSMLLKDDVPDSGLHDALKELVEKQIGERVTPEQRKAMGISDDYVDGQIKLVESKWFRRLLRYDPAPVLKQVRCPVLALNGEKDLQVAADENLEGIRRALNEGGNARVEVVKLPGLNHLFQTAKTGAPSEYGQISETFAPAALEKVSSWIREEMKVATDGGR